MTGDADAVPPDVTPPDATPPLATARTRRAWVRPVVIVAIVLVCGWLVSTFLGSIDWSAVGAALGRLSVWQVAVLVGILLVRQTLNALPLALFIPGLGVRRALLNDLTAALMAVVAPPPSDIVMRVAMFRSWGINAARGIAGATMNMLVFYVNRFAVPVLGALILAIFGQGTDRIVFACVCGVIAIILGTVVALLVRGEGLAAWFGTSAGRIVRRVRSSVDPHAWAVSATRFQALIGEKFRRGFPFSLAGLAAMVVVESCILLLALRFVGVSAAALPAYIVIGAFLLGYPLTLPPLMGLGIYDVVLLGAFMEVGGDSLEARIIAALTIWRATTILGPMILGIGSTVHWRWRMAHDAVAGTS